MAALSVLHLCFTIKGADRLYYILVHCLPSDHGSLCGLKMKSVHVYACLRSQIKRPFFPLLPFAAELLLLQLGLECDFPAELYHGERAQ